MLDLNHIPRETVVDVQTFTGIVTTATGEQWQTWVKPRGVGMVNINCIGGGAGGGAGFTDIAGNARGGGGGGGGSGQGSVIIPAHYLPDILFVSVGAGGQPGADGMISYVSIFHSYNAAIVSTNILCCSGAAAATAGTAGTGAAAGAGGSAGTIATSTAMPRGTLGNYSFIAGQVGAAGGVQTGGVGASLAVPTSGVCCTGGAGGAGVTASNFAGGAFSALTGSWFSDIRPVAAASGGNNGAGGFHIKKPLFSFGGCGGSSSNSTAGGKGGPGAYGSGGGGGGGGTTGGTGGTGGPGLVIITAW